MRKGKDPDPDPYLWLMDPDPGGPKTCGSSSGSGSPTLVVTVCYCWLYAGRVTCSGLVAVRWPAAGAWEEAGPPPPAVCPASCRPASPALPILPRAAEIVAAVEVYPTSVLVLRLQCCGSGIRCIFDLWIREDLEHWYFFSKNSADPDLVDL